MRGLMIGVFCGASIALASFAAPSLAVAQSRQVTTFTVKPRSWLDAGPVVRVGSQQNYMYDVQTSSGAPSYGARSSFNLPDRFSSGRDVIVVDYPAPAFLTGRR